MARTVILGNSGLTVGLNEYGYVHDFYYPYVGLENLTNARSNPHYIGLWVDGAFAWLHDDSWQRDITTHEDALISDITMTNESLGIGVHLEDFVDPHNDAFIRQVRVRNLSNNDKEVRVFFHQVFQISADGRGDTVMYVPDAHYLLDYKGRCSLLAYAEVESGDAFDQHAVGNTGIEGKEGTFRDAEDGELSMSAVEHASVDSTLRVRTTLAAGATETFNYWVIAADSQDQLEKVHQRLLHGGTKKRHYACVQHWGDWLGIAAPKLQAIADDRDRRVLKQSMMVIKAHTDDHGGIIASCDSSIYNYGRDYYSYVWPRDGAYAIWPLIKLGYTKEARRFFEFCRTIMHPDGYLKHKYQPDRAIGSTWHPLVHGNRTELAIQEDETAIVLIMIGEYYAATADLEYVRSMYDSFIAPAANFMARFIDRETGLPHASYDLWEEKFLTSTYTVSTVHCALQTASMFANKLDQGAAAQNWQQVASQLSEHYQKLASEQGAHAVKGFLHTPEGMQMDEVLDVSSFYGMYAFRYAADSPLMTATLQQIETHLLDQSPAGGSPRYTDDAYFRSTPAHKGNPWFVTTLWLAQYYAREGQKERSRQLIDWSLNLRLPSGLLSEQVHPVTGQAVGVTPLVWSHAELINALLDYHGS